MMVQISGDMSLDVKKIWKSLGFKWFLWKSKIALQIVYVIQKLKFSIQEKLDSKRNN